MIERTEEMINAALSAYETADGHNAAIEAVVKAVLAIIDRDYVTRWGKLSIPLGVEYQQLMAEPHFMQYLRETAEQQAEYMGGTIEFEKYMIEQDFPFGSRMTWKVRRND